MIEFIIGLAAGYILALIHFWCGYRRWRKEKYGF